MSKMSEKAVEYAAKRWRELASAQEIADEIADKFGIKIHKQAIQSRAAGDRKMFPARTRAERRAMISNGMKRTDQPWNSPAKKKPNADAYDWG